MDRLDASVLAPPAPIARPRTAGVEGRFQKRTVLLVL